MKTETRIAEENIKECKRVKINDLEITYLYWKGVSSFHKQSCERFLEFLEEQINNPYFWKDREISLNQNVEKLIYNLQEKITDLKQVIKLYEDAGL